MSVTTDLDEIAGLVVEELQGLGRFSGVRIIDDPDGELPVEYAYPFALVFPVGTDYEMKSMDTSFLTHQLGIAVFVNAVETEWAAAGQGQTAGWRAHQKAVRDHFKRHTLDGKVHYCWVSHEDPAKRVSINDQGQTDPGCLYAVSVLDVHVFQAG